MKTKYKSLRALFRSKKRWCQGIDAKDADGCAVDPSDNTAACFCLGGGAYALYESEVYDVVMTKLAKAIKPKLKGKGKGSNETIVIHYNDDPKRKFSEIQSLVRKAGV